MPQPFRLRVSFSLGKLPKRQQDFLLSFSKLDGFEYGSFLIHLANYFYLTKSNSTTKNIVGFLGKPDQKISLTFTDEHIVKFLKEYKSSDREIYCLTALYEMSNYLAFQIYSYNQAIISKDDLYKIAKLENTFFTLGLAPYLNSFSDLMLDKDFADNALIMSASLGNDQFERSVLIDAYSETLSKEILAQTSTFEPNKIEQTNNAQVQEANESDEWTHIQIA